MVTFVGFHFAVDTSCLLEFAALSRQEQSGCNLQRNMYNTQYIFFSDAHLGAPRLDDDREREQQVISFLEYVASENAVLFIVGDLFDFWFEYRQVIPRNNFATLATLYQLTTAGIEVNYLAGNHDLWLGSFLRDEIGVNIYDSATNLTTSQFNVYITHGDGEAASDKGYRFLKKIFKSKTNTRLYSLLHPDLGIAFAKRMSQVSRTRGESANFWEAEYRHFAVGKFTEGYNAVIMGHTHNPRHEKIGDNHFINLGDWIEHFSYCLLEDGEISLRKWPAREILFSPSRAALPENENQTTP